MVLDLKQSDDSRGWTARYPRERRVRVPGRERPWTTSGGDSNKLMTGSRKSHLSRNIDIVEENIEGTRASTQVSHMVR